MFRARPKRLTVPAAPRRAIFAHERSPRYRGDRRTGRRSGPRQYPVALLDGRALTASELAYAAHITPQTASGHLGKLATASLIVPAQQGRHRYYRLAGRHVAAMIESISAVAAIAPPRLRPIRIDDTMRQARMCYDHIAGRLGVTLADALREHQHVEFADDGGLVTPAGEAFFAKLGIDLRPRRAGACSAVPASTGASGAASRRRGRRGAGAAADGVALDRAQARHARAHHHADRLEPNRAHLRLLAARPHGACAAGAACRRRVGTATFALARRFGRAGRREGRGLREGRNRQGGRPVEMTLVTGRINHYIPHTTDTTRSGVLAG